MQCDYPPDIFFPEEDDEQAIDNAKAICRECPIIAKCLEFALSTRESEGVWGGTSAIDRRKMLKRRRAL